jgi:plastocyanin
MRKFFAALALATLACAGGEQAGEMETQAADMQPCEPQPCAASEPMGGTGTVHQVEMLLTADGQYVYQPATLTIKVGDTVRWLNVSGFPHNVAFYENQIPGGAKDYLTGIYQSKQGNIGAISGRLMTQPNDSFEITFAGAPTGAYSYYCTPHEALGMKATLTIQQ